MPQGFDFLGAGDVQIQGSDGRWRSLLFPAPLRLLKAGPPGGIGGLDLSIERCLDTGIGWRPAVKRSIGASRGAKNEHDGEEEKRLALGWRRHMPTLARTSPFS
jgi:hypothetical protein